MYARHVTVFVHDLDKDTLLLILISLHTRVITVIKGEILISIFKHKTYIT